MTNPAKLLLSTTAAFALLRVGCTPSAPMPEGVEMTLENVNYLEWETLDERPEYRIAVGGDVLLTTRRSAGYIHYDDPIDGLREGATDPNDREGDAVTEVEKIKAEQKERLIIRWDRAIYPQPYLGIRLGGARLAIELNNPT